MNKNKQINELLNLMACLDNVIIEEIREINRGKGHTAEEIADHLKYWIEDRMFFYEKKDN